VTNKIIRKLLIQLKDILMKTNTSDVKINRISCEIKRHFHDTQT